MFVHQDDIATITDIQDLSGKKIKVVPGETYEHVLRNNHQKIGIVYNKSTVDIFQDMKTKGI